MRLLNAYIYGFGKWQDYQLDFSKASLTVVYGENESGKSTIRQFIMFMLFGMTPKKREFYLPKTGGRLGGTLTVWMEEKGQFTIERIHDRHNGEAICFQSDGSEYSEIWLKEQLAGLNEQTFSSIYSFDSNDLNRLHAIKEKELGDVLLGIGMTGTDKINQIEKRLENLVNDLFKPQGKKPIINRLLGDAEDINRKITELALKENEYVNLKQAKYDLDEQLLTVQSKLTMLNKQKEKNEKRIQNYSVISEYINAKNELDKLPENIPFPEQGIERYQRLKEKRLPLQSEWAVLDDTYNRYRQELNKLAERRLKDGLVEDMRELFGEFNDYQEKNNYLFIKQDMNLLEKELEQEINQLNIGLNMYELEGLTFPFHIEEEWSLLKHESEQIQAEKEKLNINLDASTIQIDELNQEKNTIVNRLMEHHELNKLKEQISQNRYYSTHQQDSQSRSKIEQLAQDWKKRKRLSTQFFFFSLTALVGFLIVTVVTGQLEWLIVGIAVTGIGSAQRGVVGYSARTFENIVNTQHQQNENISLLSGDQLHHLEMKVSEQEQFQKKVNQIDTRLSQLNVELLKLEERSVFLVQKEERYKQRVLDHLEDYPFLDKVNIQYWPKLYHLLSQLLSKYKRLSEYRQRKLEYNERMKSFGIKVDQLTSQLGIDIVEDTIFSKMEQVNALLQEQEKDLEDWKKTQERAKETADRKRKVETKLLPYTEEINELWSVASVKDEDSFLKVGQLRIKQIELQELVKKSYQQLFEMIGKNELELLDRDGIWDKLLLEQQLSEQLAEIEKIETYRKNIQQQLSDTKAHIKTMEQSEDYSLLQHRYALKLDELRQYARQWAVYQTAKEKLLATKKVYQNKYLPKVMKRTTHYFNRLTSGKYSCVYPPMEGKALYVEASNGNRFQVTELSQGTKDQLYISLRIALSEVMNQHDKSPFFIDDAFVHFDANRQRSMLSILDDLALTQQVILFTCHETVKQMVDDRNNHTTQVCITG
ncbi:ATP-binding protein [Aquibacillus kalidii]|uniref:ATP-binding protein n=1 Tax=Aquibacillus kalidii TaxID=2762597 RepID=UPI001646F536|nr:AAA family ATPase [Aquibacillus kalidii]